MSTREQAIRSATHASNRAGRPMFIYRIGPAWMYTSQDQATVQSCYKRTIRDYQEIR